MTNSFFLTKTIIDPDRMIQNRGGVVLEQYESLRQFLYARVGRDGAELFAEPILSRGNDAAPATVSWYVSRAGEGRRLADLAPESRAAVEGTLRRVLASLADTLSDPDFGPLTGAALHLNAPEDIWVVDGQPFLVNWGMAPSEAQGSQSARDRHFAATLGSFLPLAAAPAISRDEWLARGYAKPEPLDAAGASVGGTEPRAGAGDGATEAAPALATGGGTGTVHPPPGDGRGNESDRWSWRWIAPVGLLVLFTAVLIWLLWPGTLLYPARPTASVIDDQGVLEAARRGNEALEERIAQLRQAIDGAVCSAEGELLLPGGYTPDGREPRPRTENGAEPQQPSGPQTARPDAPAPPPPSRLVTPRPEGGDPVALLDVLEASTAFVLAGGEQGIGHGSGFFVTPDLLVTNHHVIANALEGGRVMVTNDRLGTLTAATVVAHDGPLETTGGDYALLRVEGAEMPPYGILRPSDSLKLRQVVAAGYPSFVLETDADFRALMEGDLEAIPSLVVTDGVVNAEQNLSPQTDVVVHTAQISSGNSGGPLVDACGRIIGVNTFVRNTDSALYALNFALTSTNLLRFLEANGVAVNVTSDDCQPQVASTPPPAAEAE